MSTDVGTRGEREQRGSGSEGPVRDYLQPSPYCDWGHPAIRHLATTLTQGYQTEREQAVRLFEWVRDHVVFTISDWQYRASETLALGRGTCTNKANLFVALARAVHIPAGYYDLRVVGKAYFGPIVPPRLRRWIRDESTHVQAGLYLRSTARWVRCDPSDDAGLAGSIAHLNPQSHLAVWDGETDGVPALWAEHILRMRGPLSSIEDLFHKRPRLPRPLRRLGNLYLDYLRRHAATLPTCEAVEAGFVHELRQRASPYYLLYLALALGGGR